MSERPSVQNPILRYAEQIGWRYVTPPEALPLRGDETGFYFSDLLTNQLKKLNLGVVDAGRAEEILRKLNLLRPNIEGNRDALYWLRGEQSIFVPEENRERNVQLIDFAHPDNNMLIHTYMSDVARKYLAMAKGWDDRRSPDNHRGSSGTLRWPG